jgi:soluble lytic murein transglycosylase-like protein
MNSQILILCVMLSGAINTSTKNTSKPRSTEDCYPDIIRKESTWNPNAIGPVGERGLYQIRRKTWAWASKKVYGKALHYDKAFVPHINRKVGEWHFRWIRRTLRRSDWLGRTPSLEQILAANNAGIGTLRANKYQVRKMPRSTRNYIRDIFSFWRERRARKTTGSQKTKTMGVPHKDTAK